MHLTKGHKRYIQIVLNSKKELHVHAWTVCGNKSTKYVSAFGLFIRIQLELVEHTPRAPATMHGMSHQL